MSQNNHHEQAGPPVPLSIDARAAAIGLAATILFIHALNAIAVYLRYQYTGDSAFVKQFYAPFFQVSSEGLIPTYYSVLTLLCCAALLSLIARRAHVRQLPRSGLWALLSGIFVFLGADEGLQIHERLSAPFQAYFNTRGPLWFAWVIPGMAFTLFIGLLYLRFVWALPKRTRALFIVGGTLYILGVLGMEMVGSNYRFHHGGNLTYGILASIEEVFEMAGIAVFIYALLDYLERQGATYQLNFGEHKKP